MLFQPRVAHEARRRRPARDRGENRERLLVRYSVVLPVVDVPEDAAPACTSVTPGTKAEIQ